jgi:hypothetical protein
MNELLFFLQTGISLILVLLAGRLGYAYMVGLVGGIAVLMNIVVVKQIDLFGLSVTAGNVLYASIFLTTDIIAEHYGRREAHRAVWIGFLVSAFFAAMAWLVVQYRPGPYDFAHSYLKQAFALTPRVVAASMISYLISQHLDVRLYHGIKHLTGGRHLWLRNNLSTWTSQLIDSTLFTIGAFWGVLPNLGQIIIFTYIIKIAVAALDTPFIYLSTLPLLRPAGSHLNAQSSSSSPPETAS